MHLLKRGRPLMPGEAFVEKVKHPLLQLMKKGGVVNTVVVSATP